MLIYFTSLMSNHSVDNFVVKTEKTQSFVIFSICGKLYSFLSDKVLEVFLSENIFYIPFCPQYVPGFINRYGEPYTVIDLQALLENEKQTGRKFIILRSNENHIAFMVEDIIDILSFPENQILFSNSR
jgi:purine-binding chemotaxis protein CheW